ncbi:MAG: hypothetical protein M3Q33_11105 [Acidobacteriota bacterium]|nr:hypothetical protein [Acidobacteriota bacterium]
MITLTVLIGTNCSYYNRIFARKNLVDGANAYKERKFKEAEELFRSAAGSDPDGKTIESRTAQLFLARTLHSEYISNRIDPSNAEKAITEYKKVLAENVDDQSSFKAIANLYENLGKQDEWLKWVTDRASDEKVPPEQRAEALTSLAAKQYSCANEISDAEPVKKTVVKEGKPEFQFSKPEDPKAFEELKQCADKGYELISRAVKLDPNSDSVWSYNANLLVQKARIAEMEGNTAEKERLKAEAQKAKERFTELAQAKKAKEDAIAEEQKRKAEEANKK